MVEELIAPEKRIARGPEKSPDAARAAGKN
jgi:hypothetical protein